MTASPKVHSGDPRELLVAQVFSHLCRSDLGKETDTQATERRLWRLPEVAAHFVFNAVTDEDKRRVDPIVHRLRAEVGELINRQLDRSAQRQILAERVALARHEFVLRPWGPDDAPRFASLLANERLWEGLPEEYPGAMTEDLAHNLIAISNGWRERHYVNAVEWRHEPVGQVRLQFDSSPYPDSAEISYWIGEPYWGQGLGTRFVTLFTAESFNRWPHVQRLFAQVLDGNVPSMRVLEKAGYRYESFNYQSITKHGSKHSVRLFGVCRADYALTASAPAGPAMLSAQSSDPAVRPEDIRSY